MVLIDAAAIIAAYLLGSVSSAIVVSRAAGLPDPREHGSHNPGATNVLRTGGKAAAAATLLGDLAKGLVPVLLATWAGLAPLTLALVGLAAFLGHLYPVFFGFKGGKGVATSLGVLLGLSWQVGAAAMVTWLAVAAISRYSSLAALVALVLSPFYLWVVDAPDAYVAGIVVLVGVIVWRHRSNIRRLLAGTEGRIGERG